MTNTFRYRLTHQESHLGIAYFTPTPDRDMDLDSCLDHVTKYPNDEFMRAHARPLLAARDAGELAALFSSSGAAIQSLILETALLSPHLSALEEELRHETARLAGLTPQLFLASAALPDHQRHARLSRALSANIFEHAPLPDELPDNIMHPADNSGHPAPSTLRNALVLPAPLPRRPARQTYELAMERLYGLGVLDGPEMRHHASLAPWGLLRRWRLDRTTRCGRFDLRLEGLMTSYGRGMCLDDARASLAMEIVERYSSFADIRDMRVSGSQEAGEIRVASFRELGDAALDPDTIRLEAPYRGGPLHWLEARDRHGNPKLVPLQAVYLFTNLDEERLFSGLGSTGLASGNTSEEAKVSGLLEVLERDAESVNVFDRSRCFRATSRNPEVANLLDRYRSQGIDPIFQDLTTDMGVPCFKCFAHLPQGGLVKATGAALSGSRAALSAMTEVPFPFPGDQGSAPYAGDLPVRDLEDLPDYGTGSAAGDLLLLETILAAHGLEPLYVNLTKRELRLPVYRSIVPGLEIVSDFDRFTRVSPRLWREVLRLREKGD